MKYLILILSFFSLNTLLFSQDSIKVRTEIDTFSKANYEGQFDYVFARKEAKKQLFKLGGSRYNSFELASESKLTQDISLSFSLGNTFQGNFISAFFFKLKNKNESILYLSNNIKLGIEPRWYYTMKRDIKNGLIADNLNGNYIGLRTNLGFFSSEFSGHKYNEFTASYELTWGMQPRILHNQYFDFSIGTGVVHHSNIYNEYGGKRNQNEGLLNSQFTYGIILDGNLFKRQKEVNCEALHCFEEEKSLWKTGINNVFFANSTGIGAGIGIANERKIHNSQWSIESRLGISASQSTLNIEGYKFKSNYFGGGFGLTPRLYWDLNKRIAKGKSANNLSGKYVGLTVNYGQGKGSTFTSDTSLSKFNSNYKIKAVSISPIIGYQKRLLNHLYLDINAGYGATWVISISDNKDLSQNFWAHGFSSGFTFGFCF